MLRFISIFILTILLTIAGRSGKTYFESTPGYTDANSVCIKGANKHSNNSESNPLRLLNRFEKETKTDKILFFYFTQVNNNNIHNVNSLLHSASNTSTVNEILFEADSSPPLFC